MMSAWAVEHGMTYLGALRETQAYVKSVEQGLTLFDMPPSKVEADLAQWAPILDWLEPVFRKPAASVAEPEPEAAAPAERPTVVVPTPSRLTTPAFTPLHDTSPQALAQAARTTLTLPQNLGELSSSRQGLKGRLGRLLGLNGRLNTAGTP